jgi:hypothetical protein
MIRTNPTPPQEVLQELFRYDNGVLYWRKSRGGLAAGSEAGWKVSNNYVRIHINKRIYFRHRLIYALLIKDPGDLEIDHINGIPGDDRIENLRLADRRSNHYNRSRYSNNTSGHKGVNWDASSSRWRARIRLPNGRSKHLGLFTSLSEAADAYRQAALQLHGEFACFS